MPQMVAQSRNGRMIPPYLFLDGNRLRTGSVRGQGLRFGVLAPAHLRIYWKNMVSLNFASWNQLDGWLRQVHALRKIA